MVLGIYIYIYDMRLTYKLHVYLRKGIKNIMMTWIICISGIVCENIMDIFMYDEITANDRLYVRKQFKESYKNDNVYAYARWVFEMYMLSIWLFYNGMLNGESVCDHHKM